MTAETIFTSEKHTEKGCSVSIPRFAELPILSQPSMLITFRLMHLIGLPAIKLRCSPTHPVNFKDAAFVAPELHFLMWQGVGEKIIPMAGFLVFFHRIVGIFI